MHDRQRQTDRFCDWPDCDRDGDYRAPRSAEQLREYYWFCLEHVRQYNREWDYFQGMTPAEIDGYRRASIIGHRPTWRLGLRSLGPEWDVADPLDLLSLHPGVPDPFESVARRAKRGRLRPRERQALATLGLDETASAPDIKSRFKTLVKRYHPDTNGGRGAEECLRRVIHAYAVLKENGLANAEKA